MTSRTTRKTRKSRSRLRPVPDDGQLDDQLPDDITGIDITENATNGPESGPAGGPEPVRISNDPHAIRVLTELLDNRGIPGTYVRDGRLVAVEAVSGSAPTAGDDDAPLPLAAFPVGADKLAALLSHHAHVVNGTGSPVTPTKTVRNAVLSRRHWPGLPALRGLISAPVLRRDGTLLQDPGYDETTGYYLAARTRMPRVPDHPSPSEVDTACSFFLDRFLADFPWRGDADRANFLALLATQPLRPYTRALAPFGIVDATMPGSGKTILTSSIGLLVGQRVWTWPDNDEELRKAVTTALADQVGAIVWDNLVEGHVIKSPVLARLITERTWTDRRLGSNSAATLPNERLWLATGNNLRTGGDMASRSVWVRLDPNCPRPEARTGFAIPNLDTWILDPDNQATVLHHLLVLIVDWTRHGAPVSADVPQMRQFTTWARHLGGFLAHHGIPGFLDNHADNAQLDEDDAEWAQFLHAWHNIFSTRPVGARDIRASAEPEPGRPDPWHGTFPTTRTGQPLSVKAVGVQLRGQVGRWHRDIVLRSERDPTTNANTYWVERETPQTTSGTSGLPGNQP